jgi:hypothetical protein
MRAEVMPGSSDDDRELLGHKLEWERARQMLETGDEKILDLRKVGFGFVTTLITASAYFGGKDALGESTYLHAGPLAGITAMVAVVGLYFCDQEVALRQSATAWRAALIERFTAIELTDFLRARSYKQRWSRFRCWIYVAFLAVAGFVGAAGPLTTLLAPPEGGAGSVALASCFAVGGAWLVATGLVVLLGSTKLTNSRVTALRPGMTDWTLSCWSYDSSMPVFLQIANQSAMDDHVPCLGDHRTVAKLRSIATGVTYPIECSNWSEPLEPNLPWILARLPARELPRVREPHPVTQKKPWKVGFRVWWALSKDAGTQRWLLRGETSLCVPISLDQSAPEGWYEILIAGERALKRRLLVKKLSEPSVFHSRIF